MRKFLLFLIIVICAGVFSYNWTPTRHYILVALDAVDYIDRKVRRRLGIPLAGTPDLAKLRQRLKEENLELGSAVFMRIFKREHELELWIKRDNKFVLFETYPICRWSGRLGPKLKQGDRQAPEGFYTVSRGQLNPNSRWYRSFNLGYPNLLDRSYGRTGDYLMVHGGCSSIGCYAMTNPVMGELWEFITHAFRGGQKRFHVHVFPFRMTEKNLAIHSGHQWHAFWSDLKAGYDLFEASRVPPQISVCRKRYQAIAGREGSVGNQTITRQCRKINVGSL